MLDCTGFKCAYGTKVIFNSDFKEFYMIAKKAQEMTPFIVMEVLEEAVKMEQAGVDVIHLEVGEPDFDAPDCVKHAVAEAVKEGHSSYTHSLGDLDLREEIASFYNGKYNVSVKSDQVTVSSGSSPAIMLALSSIIDPGDEVIISDPGYACYGNFIRFCDGVPVPVPVYEQDCFEFRTDLIKAAVTARTKAIIINSPMNPTGTVMSAEAMKAVADLGITVISDEIYHGLVYEAQEHSILEFTDNAFVLNGFSKAYAMTGMRLGYLIAPPEYMRVIRNMQQNLFICANSISQRAGIAALKEAGDDVTDMNQKYDERRKFIIKRLREIGFKITVEPTGAFYVFVNASHLGRDSYKLAFDILKTAHVACTPGVDFGKNGEGYLRFSYANSLENIAEAMNRLERYVKGKSF